MKKVKNDLKSNKVESNNVVNDDTNNNIIELFVELCKNGNIESINHVWTYFKTNLNNTEVLDKAHNIAVENKQIEVMKLIWDFNNSN